jgi:hypothetical protein
MAVEFVFGEHWLDVDCRELRRRGEPIAPQPQVFDFRPEAASTPPARRSAMTAESGECPFEISIPSD